MASSFRMYLSSMIKDLYLARKLWEIAKTWVGMVSSLYAFAVLLNNLVGISAAKGLCEKWWVALVVLGALCALWANREKTFFVATAKVAGLQIQAKVGDLFACDAQSVVIPTNTFFRTRMKGEYISPRSVQGAFQSRIYTRPTEDLDKAIADSLRKQGLNGERARDEFGVVNRFPVGTVAKVDYKGKHYYFLAMNDVNEYGKPVGQSYENVSEALDGLKRAIHYFGHCDELAMPLVGAGRAAIKDASCDRVAFDIVDMYLGSQEKLAQKLIVCVSPEDYVQQRIDFERLAKYIGYRCEFDQLAG